MSTIPLTPTRGSILKALRRYFYLRARQINELVLPGDKDGSVTRENMRKLLAWGLVRRHEPLKLEAGQMTAPPIYVLTMKGACALAAETGDVSVLLEREANFADWLSLNHYCALSSLHITIDAAFASQTHAKQHALYFEHEVISDSKDPSKKYRLHTSFTDSAVKCCPDSAFEIEVNGHRRAIFCEREMGSDTPARVAAKKVKGFAELQRTALFKRHFPLAKDFRVLAVCPNAGWRDALRSAFKDHKDGKTTLKPGAELWMFVSVTDIKPETFLHTPILHVIRQKDGVIEERGPLPFVPAPGGATGGGSSAGGSTGGTL